MFYLCLGSLIAAIWLFYAEAITKHLINVFFYTDKRGIKGMSYPRCWILSDNSNPLFFNVLLLMRNMIVLFHRLFHSLDKTYLVTIFVWWSVLQFFVVVESIIASKLVQIQFQVQVGDGKKVCYRCVPLFTVPL